jgi:hypothetical protein
MMKNIDFMMSSPPNLRIALVVMNFIDSVLSVGLSPRVLQYPQGI